MSELEKLQRSQYQKKRKIWIAIQTVLALLLVLAALGTLFAYLRLSEQTYVYYTEQGGANHKVFLGDSAYYTEEYLDKNHAYISALIDHVEADFYYEMNR